jgi:hypothetical protein
MAYAIETVQENDLYYYVVWRYNSVQLLSSEAHSGDDHLLTCLATIITLFSAPCRMPDWSSQLPKKSRLHQLSTSVRRG